MNPHAKLSEHRVTSSLFNVVHDSKRQMDASHLKRIDALHTGWSSQSEKTLLMSTPKCLGDQIWQIYLGKTDDEPPWYQTSMTILQISFSDFQVYLVTLPIEPPICEFISSCTLSLQSNIKIPIVNIYK